MTTPSTDFSTVTSDRADSAAQQTARLLGIIANLREHCPWTAQLTHASLTEYLLEESYELIEAIEGGDTTELAGELGDVLFQVAVHARLAEESGLFDFAEVARGLSEKMIRRNPHVFRPDGSLQETFPATIAEIVHTWDEVKRAERAHLRDEGDGGGDAVRASAARADAFAGIPVALPALALAQKTLDRAQRAGLALGESSADGGAASRNGKAGMTEDELGKSLFDVVRAARAQGLDAERALRNAVRAFQSGEC
ncbi:MazG nucleotide pyrophosphohydrolase domain-containing protein [Arthrobacter sp. GMC3]|uniref:MazG nucleotide pyrophosphohydrolase domain-containing protein n=1 Tax=Arthrobacter sp. GMC3 TaxID=2058894 RepID=UPI000CE32244|nr:MazG nucleotide pyrophosphohydrolase domain-containing protein [Arthrobacter sp. GMC3]